MGRHGNRHFDAVGEDLAKHFPYDAASDTNELPDDVDYGPGA